MTSRDPSEKRSWDQLDTMIRWTLRRSMRDVTPPPGVWGRIKERMLQQGKIRWVAWRREFRAGAEAFALSVLGSVAGTRADIPYPALAMSGGWNGECLCWTDDYGILLRRLTVL
jgi:hypothetical protein